MDAKELKKETKPFEITFYKFKYELIAEYIKDDLKPDIYIAPFYIDSENKKCYKSNCDLIDINPLFQDTDEAIKYIKKELNKHIKNLSNSIK